MMLYEAEREPSVWVSFFGSVCLNQNEPQQDFPVDWEAEKNFALAKYAQALNFDPSAMSFNEFRRLSCGCPDLSKEETNMFLLLWAKKALALRFSGEGTSEKVALAMLGTETFKRITTETPALEIRLAERLDRGAKMEPSAFFLHLLPTITNALNQIKACEVPGTAFAIGYTKGE